VAVGVNPKARYVTIGHDRANAASQLRSRTTSGCQLAALWSPIMARCTDDGLEVRAGRGVDATQLHYQRNGPGPRVSASAQVDAPG
jgi:hypothetical protein